MTEAKRRGRPPKARLEGAESGPIVAREWTGPSDEAKQQLREHFLGDRVPTATPEHDALAVIVEQFKREHAELWESIRLGPTQHGIEQMIEALSS